MNLLVDNLQKLAEQFCTAHVHLQMTLSGELPKGEALKWLFMTEM